MHVRFLVFSIESSRKNRRFIWIGESLASLFSGLKYDLMGADIDISVEKYLTSAFFSALIYGALFLVLFAALFTLKDGALDATSGVITTAIGLAFFVIFFFLHIIYPGLTARHYANDIDQNLLFALKSMLIQITSWVSLFDSMANISQSGYGAVSKEFQKVVREISGGESETNAIEKLALRTKSDHIKKMSWQLLTSIKSGASLEGALTSVVQHLSNSQFRNIKNYAAELNIWILTYLLLAAAIPTIGITFLVILSAMGGSSIGKTQVALMIAFAVLMQAVLIGFVKTRMPKVFN